LIVSFLSGILASSKLSCRKQYKIKGFIFMSSEYRNEVKAAVRESKWTFWYIFWPLLLLFVIIGITGWALTILSRPGQVIEKVTEPDKIIQNYEWFENTYNDALAIDRQIKTAKQTVVDFETSAEDRANWKRPDITEYSRLNSVLQGLRYQRDNIVSDYNARSNQLTRNLFKSSDLPYQLNVTDGQIVEVWEK
jgi:hypothetical protein